MKKLIQIMVMILLCSFLTVSASPFWSSDDFVTGSTFFNEEMSDPVIYTQSLTDPMSNLVIGDINNDSIDDYVIIDNDVIEVYNNKSFDMLTSNDTDCVNTYSNLLIFDIDGDGYNEIIYACQSSSHLYAKRFNGTGWSTVLSKDTSLENHINGEIQIACADVDDCVAVFAISASESSSNRAVYAMPFNSTKGASYNALTGFVGSSDWLRCFGAIPYIEVADVDNTGGEKEYIISMHRGQADASNNDVEIWIGDTDDGGVWNNLHYVILADSTTGVVSGDNCYTDNFGRYITSPLAVDIDGGTSGLEIVIGYQPSANDFRLKIYDKDLNLLDTEPDVFQAEGNIISNPVLMNALPDTERKEVCVLGYKQGDGTVSLMCGSIESSTDEIEYDSTVSDFTSGTSTPPIDELGNFEMLVYQVDANTDFTEGSNLDEIVTTFGVLKLEKDAIDSDLEQLYAFTNRNGSVTPYKNSEEPYYDLVVVSDSKMYYFDDQEENQPPYLGTDSSINPTPLSVWQQNTTVDIDMYVIDPESDTVCARTILYYNDATFNESVAVGGCAASGTHFQTSHFVGNITSQSLLAIIINDTGSLTERTILYNFTVGAYGAENGDSVFYITDPLLASDSTILSTTETEAPIDGNIMQESVQSYGESTGLGTTIIWIIIMGITIVIGLYAKPDHVSDGVMFWGIATVVVIEFIIGVMQGFISTGVLWTLLILGLIVGGFFLSRSFLSGNGGYPQ